MEAERVRQAAQVAFLSWQKEESTCEAVHSECAFYLQPMETASTFFQSSRPSNWLPGKDTNCVLAFVKVLPVGRQTAAFAQLRVGNLAGFLVLLRAAEQWQVISVALASSPSTTAVSPETFAAVSDLVWKGYMNASRICDGALMAQHFHPTCRLTYSNQQTDTIQIVPAESFYNMVQHRYTKVPPHLPFQHLKDDYATTSQGDTLQSIEFVTPRLAMVVLKVGHPPFLWTDLLTCAQLEDGGQWWIVHKSSENEPFLLDQAKPVA